MNTHTRVLSAPCTNPQAAADAANHLRTQHVDVLGTDGRHVLIPAGWSAMFVWDLAEQLRYSGYGHDDELALWAAEAANARPEPVR